jgi:hypothetical protein
MRFIGLRAVKHSVKDIIYPSKSATEVSKSYQDTLRKLKKLLIDGSTVRTEINVNRVISAVGEIGAVPTVLYYMADSIDNFVSLRTLPAKAG